MNLGGAIQMMGCRMFGIEILYADVSTWHLTVGNGCHENVMILRILETHVTLHNERQEFCLARWCEVYQTRLAPRLVICGSLALHSDLI